MKFEDTVYAFLKELGHFDYDVSGVDLVWDLIFPDSKGKWKHVYVTKYRKTSYISHIDGNSCSLEVVPKKSVQAMVSFGFSSYEDGCLDRWKTSEKSERWTSMGDQTRGKYNAYRS